MRSYFQRTPLVARLALRIANRGHLVPCLAIHLMNLARAGWHSRVGHVDKQH